MSTLPAPQFPGFSRPSTDFQAVQDQRRAQPLTFLVDLSTARSIAAGTALTLPVAGNSFYSDPIIDSSGNAVGGVAVVYFTDANLIPQSTPFTVAPQFIAKVPFVGLIIENPAQPGKFMRINYGVDLDFTPGINAQVSISGTVATANASQVPATSFSSTAALSAGTAESVFSVATNTNGAIVIDAQLMSFGAGLVVPISLNSFSGPVTAWTNGHILSIAGALTNIGGAYQSTGKMTNPQRLAPARNAQFFNGSVINETGAARSVSYTLL